jgi:putative sporulation protein YyaC
MAMNNEVVQISFDESKVKVKLRKHVRQLFKAYKVSKCKNLVIVCVGTDKVFGDALGPLVGTRLKQDLYPENIHIFGTMNNPVHALNIHSYKKRIDKIKDAFVIAVDAALGPNVGNISIREAPLKPGAGLKKKLPQVGHISIIGTVNTYDDGEDGTYSIYNVDERMVLCMAEIIAHALKKNIDKLCNKKLNVLLGGNPYGCHKGAAMGNVQKYEPQRSSSTTWYEQSTYKKAVLGV